MRLRSLPPFLAELRRGLAERRRAEELQREFVSVASHELRGPIAVVHGIATTLHGRQGQLDAGQEERLRDALLRQTTRLGELTEQLLDMSRLEAGRLAVEPARFRPCAVVEELVPRVAPADCDEVEIRIDPAAELVSDRAAFERVLGNLLANAIKYGAPPVLVRGGGRGNAFEVAVEDNGPGVAPEFVPHLFERFARSESSRRGAQPGAGLGLAIARRYAEALGADLRYERAGAAGGARFVFSLPAG